MSLAHAILGLLQTEPMSGYELKTRCFDESIAHFWHADQAQIYRTLEQMAGQGWVESELEVQEKRPNRKIYSLTDSGRAELRRWLTRFHDLPVYREPFLIQLFFAEGLTNAAILELIEGQLEAHRERLMRYEQIPLPPLDVLKEMRRDLTLQRLTLEMGLASERAIVAWLEMAAETVRNLPQA